MDESTSVIEVGDLGFTNRTYESPTPGTSEPSSSNRNPFGSINDITRTRNNTDSDSGTGRRKRNSRNSQRDGDSGSSRTSENRNRSSEESETNVPVKKGGRKSATKVDPDAINLLILVLFAVIASVRGPHWKKEASQTIDIASQITEYLNTLPLEKRKQINGLTLPISLLCSVAMLVAEPLAMEREIMQQRKRHANEISTPERVQFNGQATPTANAQATEDSANSREDFGFGGIGPAIANHDPTATHLSIAG